MSITWNEVTKFSQIIAIILFVAVFALGFVLGKVYAEHHLQPASGETPPVSLGEKPIADVTYTCNDDKTVRAIYRSEEVELLLSDGRHFTVPQTVSGSGARYASEDESFVFWNKGNTAFITEGNTTTFEGCETKPEPQ